MFSLLKSYISGAARFKIRGLNLDKLIAALLKENFVLRNLKRPSYQVLIFDVSARQGKRAAAFLKKQNYEFEKKEFGLTGAFKTLGARAGLVAGLILCAAGVFIYGNYVRDIKIEGIERIKKSAVTELLDGMGVRRGANKKKINGENIAVALNGALDDAANVTVRLKGTSLIIRIYETLYKDPVYNPDAPFNIVSAYDAVILRVVATNGTIAAGAGDIVKKGDILIAGYNLDAEGNATDARASGEVYGRVFFSADNVFFKVREEYVRTGNVKSHTSTALFGRRVGGANGCPYTLYDKEVSESAAFKNFFMPFRITRERFWELALQTNEYDYERYKDGIISEVTAAAEAKVPKSAIVTDSKTDIREIDNFIITVYNIETEMRINA